MIQVLTASVIDILNDIDTTLVEPALSGVSFPSGVKIMRGISRPWSAVHDSVIAEVKALIAKYPTYTLEATGHSLGGSLTYLSHVALAQNFPGKQLTSSALAAFPIGNSAWASFAGAQAGTLKRGNNIADGVPVSLCWSVANIGSELADLVYRTCTSAVFSISNTMEP
jgi:hypothetical protein